MSEYHYTECGLDNIYLINGFEITESHDGDHEIFIHDINGLHKAIGMGLIRKAGLLLGKEIKFIRKALDYSQATLAQVLGCTYQTIYLWESGKGEIPKTADHFLRVIFFIFLNPDENKKLYQLIHEISELDAASVSRNTQLKFEECFKQWRLAG